MASPLTRVELDKLKCPCGKPNCGDIWLKPACHKHSGVEASYDQKTGVLQIACFQCKKLIVHILVAKDLIVV